MGERLIKRMTKTYLQSAIHILFFFAVAAACSMPAFARADNAQWTSSGLGDYSSVCCQTAGNVHFSMTLSSPGITVNYYGQAFLVDSSEAKLRQLKSGDTLNSGDRVLFEFSPHLNSDISWYATGSAWGTPYGYWVGDAADPGGNSCNNSDMFASGVGIIDLHYGAAGGYANLYARYAVTPPDETISTTGAWSGCVSAGGSDKICTVGSGESNASAELTFAATQSKFYGDMTYAFTTPNFVVNSFGNTTGCRYMGALGGAITIPAQTITYNFTTGAGSNPPTTPTVSADGACTLGSPLTLIFSSTDPFGHDIKYGVDWDNNGSVDQWVPPSGFVPSGTSQSASRTYAIAGEKTVQVLVQNDQGVSSEWASHTFDCADAPEVTECPEGYILQDGACIATECPVGYVQQGGSCIFSACPEGYHLQGTQCVATAGECTAGPYCQGADLVDGCTNEKLQTCDWGCFAGACNPVPSPNATLKAVPSLAKRDNTTVVTWSSQFAVSCTVSGTNGDSWTGLNGSQTSSPISSQTTYTLRCQGHQGASPSSVQKSVIVNIAPTFEEK
jgi:hypothetical protein